MTTPIIEVQNLRKEYKIARKGSGIRASLKYLVKPEYDNIEAVKGISFQVSRGESVALLGANGAGKSTTIKMLTGIMRPDGGSVCIMGLDPFRRRMENVRKIGVVFGQKTQLWWDIPVAESFYLLKNIYEIPDAQYARNMELFQGLLGLDAFLGQPARKLSLGQRVRADLAAALLHEPPLLFLDEPTIGIDVAAKQKIYAFLKEINQKQHTTFLLTSHDMKDLKTLCSRLMILDQGKIVFDGSMEALFETYPGKEDLEDIIIEVFHTHGKRREHGAQEQQPEEAARQA